MRRKLNQIMSFQTHKDGKFSIIQADISMLDGVVAPDLKALFVQLTNEGSNKIILDLSAVKYCDSSGLSSILIGHRLCRDTNGLFVLCGLQSDVAKIIQIAQLDKVFSIAENIDAAKQTAE